jgi:glycerophosphoryl diester phosphodiesterase
MIVLSHRGYWKVVNEKNKSLAFQRSFSLGYGTETDIRDYKGELVISHDIADENSLSVKEMFDIYNKYDNSLPLALNIKADGLQLKLKDLISKYNITNYFVFDMSVPDGLQYLKQNIKSFTRESEYEKIASFYDDACGVWLDEFQGHWIEKEVIRKHINNNKQICIVSPDLHKRDYKKEWQHYNDIEKELGINNLMICTDYPEHAKEFFDG